MIRSRLAFSSIVLLLAALPVRAERTRMKVPAAAAPVLTLQTTGDVFANTSGSASVQVDTAAKYKYGIQFATKV